MPVKNVNNFCFDFTVLADGAEPWQIFFQDSATPAMVSLIHFHNHIMFYFLFISIFASWALFRSFLFYDEVIQNYRKELFHSDKFIYYFPFIKVETIIFPIILVFIMTPLFVLLYFMKESSALNPLLKITWYQNLVYSEKSDNNADKIFLAVYFSEPLEKITNVPENDLTKNLKVFSVIEQMLLECIKKNPASGRFYNNKNAVCLKQITDLKKEISQDICIKKNPVSQKVDTANIKNKKDFMRIWSKNINYPKPLEKKSKLEICSEIHSTRLEMRSIYANLYRYNAEIKATNSASEKTLIFNKIDNNIKEFAVLKNREKLLKERLKILFSSKEEVLKSNIKKIFNQHFCECKHLEDTFKNEILENLKYYLSDSTADIYDNLIEEWKKVFSKTK